MAKLPRLISSSRRLQTERRRAFSVRTCPTHCNYNARRSEIGSSIYNLVLRSVQKQDQPGMKGGHCSTSGVLLHTQSTQESNSKGNGLNSVRNIPSLNFESWTKGR